MVQEARIKVVVDVEGARQQAGRARGGGAGIAGDSRARDNFDEAGIRASLGRAVGTRRQIEERPGGLRESRVGRFLRSPEFRASPAGRGFGFAAEGAQLAFSPIGRTLLGGVGTAAAGELIAPLTEEVIRAIVGEELVRIAGPGFTEGTGLVGDVFRTGFTQFRGRLGAGAEVGKLALALTQLGVTMNSEQAEALGQALREREIAESEIASQVRESRLRKTSRGLQQHGAATGVLGMFAEATIGVNEEQLKKDLGKLGGEDVLEALKQGLQGIGRTIGG